MQAFVSQQFPDHASALALQPRLLSETYGAAYKDRQTQATKGHSNKTPNHSVKTFTERTDTYWVDGLTDPQPSVPQTYSPTNEIQYVTSRTILLMRYKLQL